MNRTTREEGWDGTPASGGEAASLVESAMLLRWRAPELALLLADRAVNAAGGDRSAVLRADHLAAFALNRLGRHGAAVHRLLPPLADADTPAALRHELNVELAHSALALGEPGPALNAVHPVLAAGDDLSATLRGMALVITAEACGALGRADVVPSALDEADELYQEDPYLDHDTTLLLRAAAATVHAAHHRRSGAAAKALTQVKSSRELLRGLADPEHDSGQVSGRLMLELVLALLDLGEGEVAIQEARPVLRRPVRAAAACSLGWLRLALATRVHLAQARHEPALALLADAVELTQRHGADAVLAECLEGLSHVHEVRGEFADALHCVRSARAAEGRHRRSTEAARAALLKHSGWMQPDVTALVDQVAPLLAGRHGDRAEPDPATGLLDPETFRSWAERALVDAGAVSQVLIAVRPQAGHHCDLLCELCDQLRLAVPDGAVLGRAGENLVAVLLRSMGRRQAQGWVDNFLAAVPDKLRGEITVGVAQHRAGTAAVQLHADAERAVHSAANRAMEHQAEVPAGWARTAPPAPAPFAPDAEPGTAEMTVQDRHAPGLFVPELGVHERALHEPAAYQAVAPEPPGYEPAAYESLAPEPLASEPAGHESTESAAAPGMSQLDAPRLETPERPARQSAADLLFGHVPTDTGGFEPLPREATRGLDSAEPEPAPPVAPEPVTMLMPLSLMPPGLGLGRPRTARSSPWSSTVGGAADNASTRDDGKSHRRNGTNPATREQRVVPALPWLASPPDGPAQHGPDDGEANGQAPAEDGASADPLSASASAIVSPGERFTNGHSRKHAIDTGEFRVHEPPALQGGLGAGAAGEDAPTSSDARRRRGDGAPVLVSDLLPKAVLSQGRTGRRRAEDRTEERQENRVPPGDGRVDGAATGEQATDHAGPNRPDDYLADRSLPGDDQVGPSPGGRAGAGSAYPGGADQDLLGTHGGEQTGGDVLGGERERPDLPRGDLPRGDLPRGDLPGGDLPGVDLPGGDLPSGERAGGDLPGGDLPGGDLRGDLPGNADRAAVSDLPRSSNGSSADSPAPESVGGSAARATPDASFVIRSRVALDSPGVTGTATEVVEQQDEQRFSGTEETAGAEPSLDARSRPAESTSNGSSGTGRKTHKVGMGDLLAEALAAFQEGQAPRTTSNGTHPFDDQAEGSAEAATGYPHWSAGLYLAADPVDRYPGKATEAITDPVLRLPELTAEPLWRSTGESGGPAAGG